jgi:S1-C subfamily serine protease
MGSGSTYLGSIPDFTPVDRGVKISGATSGSPADAAGLRGGDVIVGLGGHEVADLQGLTDALRAHKPGQTVDMRVLRDGKELMLRVTLGVRK